MGVESLKRASTSKGAVFLSYASQDAEAARRICEALRSAGVEVWLDQSELRGGDAWDRQIRERIHDCQLFIPVISANTEARDEGYFRREWKLAADRTHDMAEKKTFLLPVVIDATSERGAAVPDKFHEVQWTRLAGGEAPPEFVARVVRLLSQAPTSATSVRTPRGPAATAPIVPSGVRGSRLQRTLSVTIGMLALALMAYLVVDKLWTPEHGVPAAPATSRGVTAPSSVAPAAATAFAPPPHSIAVLPFTDMSQQRDLEYFADGMAEQIIDLLARTGDLHVPARTSSFYFKGKSSRLSEIAQELNVAHVLEGSVRKSGNRLRITAQLVRTDNGYDVWSETYDRDVRDIFHVQDEIANAVVQALRVTLMGGTLARPRGGTQSVDAYQLYLRAEAGLDQNSRASLEAARRFAEQATKIDPHFGLAWLALANQAMLVTDIGGLAPPNGYERARRLAQHALELSPELTDAHAVLSYVRRTLDWDWVGAEAEALEGLTLDPTSPAVLTMAGLQSATLGKWDEAELRLDKALTRDPLNTSTLFNFGTILYNANRFGKAEAAFRKTLELAPGYVYGHAYLAKTLLAEGNATGALATLEQEQDEEARTCFLPMALRAVGRPDQADQALSVLANKFGYDAAYFVAMAYAHRGDRNRAVEWLERAYVQKDLTLVEMVGEPLLNSLAGDPGYQAFLRKMKLPDVRPPTAR
jgi:TolB-like protein/tetratricopeptide (TPR) repeat protein